MIKNDECKIYLGLLSKDLFKRFTKVFDADQNWIYKNNEMMITFKICFSYNKNTLCFTEYVDKFASMAIGDVFWEKGVKSQVMKQTKGKYPAPLKIVEVSISLYVHYIGKSLHTFWQYIGSKWIKFK